MGKVMHCISMHWFAGTCTFLWDTTLIDSIGVNLLAAIGEPITYALAGHNMYEDTTIRASCPVRARCLFTIYSEYTFRLF